MAEMLVDLRWELQCSKFNSGRCKGQFKLVERRVMLINCRHSPSRLGTMSSTGENGRKESNGFASPVNKCRFKEGKCRTMSNPSEQKPFHYSNSSLRESWFAFADSPEFSNDGSWPIQFKGNTEDAVDFHCETASPDTLLQESVSKHEEIKVNLQQESCRNLELVEEFSKGDNGMPSEKMARGATISNNHTQESEGTEDTITKMALGSPGNVEEISSPLMKSDKHESKAITIKKKCDAEIPLKCKISNEGGQVMMFKSYVHQLFCVQKRY
ncbi:hypothetical protein L6164_029576 [Bauhinia variegata]|uniref:Uncharacterized protein n=1 Tax=Bauhinia variegata TaxID=167791 RepID=A0ACB9L9J7_BAUVA|nr:hypothetical protein L6164_029576 [Bauhinia variegata]